jgi:hypothetical protein
MKFRINLRPAPAAPYFTVPEHLSAFSGMNVNLNSAVLEIEKDIKSLLNMDPKYKVHLLAKKGGEQFLSKYKVVVKDDPVTGRDLMKVDSDVLRKDAILDLSYSLPQVPLDTFRVHSAILDPEISLGVPADYLILITDLKDVKEQIGVKDIVKERAAYLLEKVLKDYLNKGKEVLLNAL